ncbi:MAG: hypothetical protein ACP5KN_12060 [Armatimonadota bacterium]
MLLLTLAYLILEGFEQWRQAAVVGTLGWLLVGPLPVIALVAASDGRPRGPLLWLLGTIVAGAAGLTTCWLMGGVVALLIYLGVAWLCIVRATWPRPVVRRPRVSAEILEPPPRPGEGTR